MANNLNSYEKLLRKEGKSYLPPVAMNELAAAGLVSFLCSPFLSAVLLMIPLIGQLLFVIALSLTLVYFYVRKSVGIILISLAAHAIFIISLFTIIQQVKHKVDVALFFMMATCIPITIFYCLLIAGRTWYLIDMKHKNKPR